MYTYTNGAVTSDINYSLGPLKQGNVFNTTLILAVLYRLKRAIIRPA